MSYFSREHQMFAFKRRTRRGLHLAVVFTSASSLLPGPVRPLPRPGSPVQQLPEWNDSSQRLEKRYVSFDSETNEYVVQFPESPGADSGDSKRMIVFRFRPEFIVEPRVRVALSKSTSGQFVYEYTVSNAKSAPASIRMFSLVVGSNDASIGLFHPNWVSAGLRATGMLVAPQAALFSGQDLRAPSNMGRFVTWMSSDRGKPVEPGIEVTGFRLQSDRLPGITTAYAGTGITLKTSVEIPPEVLDQLVPLVAPENNYKTLVTIGPKYVINTAVLQTLLNVIQDYRESVRRLIGLGYLSSDSLYIQDVLKSLDSAAKSPGAQLTHLKRTPETPLEQEIGAALKLTLNLDSE